jgi:hypothetical protein
VRPHAVALGIILTLSASATEPPRCRHGSRSIRSAPSCVVRSTVSSRSATGSTSRSLRQGTVDRRDAGIWTGGQCVNSSQVNTGVARPLTGPRRPARFSRSDARDIGDKWDLVAQRPQLPGNSGSSGQRSCDGRRPSATRLSRGAIRAAMSVARTHPFALTRRAATNVCSPKSATTSRTPFPNAIPARSSILSVIGAGNCAQRSGASPSPLSAAVSSQAVAHAGGSPAC